MHRPTPTTPVADLAGIDYQRCRWCHTPSYRRILCPVCASPDLETAHSDGLGVVTRPPHGTQREALVQMREGFTLQGRIVGRLCGGVHPGAPVRLTTGPDQGSPFSSGPESAHGAMEFRLSER